MKKAFFVLIVMLFGISISYADQLAYISKTDAERAAQLIKGKKVILFCGCCAYIAPEKVKVSSVQVKFTGYGEYYEVVISYKDSEGQMQTKALDLAYVWIKSKKFTQTVGSALGMEHDPCKEAISWKQ